MADASLFLIVLTPLVGALLVLLTGRSPNLRETISILTGFALLAQVISITPEVLAGEIPHQLLATPVPGLPIALALEPLGLLFALIASSLWIVTTVYAIGYMRGHGESDQTRFFTFFAIAISATMGVALSANLITLFLFYELLTLSTYPLVTHAGTAEARRGGRVYLGILIGTSMAFLLPAIIATWYFTGSVTFEAGGILAGKISPLTTGILFALFAFGIGKAALMPFHRWLPAAMVAPTPVSALLHAVAVVKAGVFSLLKIVIYVFGIDLLAQNGVRDLMLWVVAITILGASVVAMHQDNLKRRLAYSTISQLSYVVLGAVLASAAGVAGAAIHIATHAVGKITLFFCAGAILVAAHKTRVSELDGLGRQMPVTMGAFLIASISIAGLPPLAGMWGKWYLAVGALDSGYAMLVGVLMVSTLLNIAYLIPIPIRAFFGGGAEPKKPLKEAPIPCLLAIITTATLCVILFFFPSALLQFTEALLR
ncbi:MAG: proton-conducting transporter membrane subunit [Arenicellales bacterium]|jgi:multicomponent Na+:H+ antiporter subunit D